jgi:hypothetical protein
MKSITRHLTVDRLAWTGSLTVVVVVSFSAAVLADDRPTPEAVAKAVKESRAAFVQSQRPDEYLKIVQQMLNDARKRRIEANNEPKPALRKRRIDTTRDEIAALEAELKQVKARKGRADSVGSHVSGNPVFVDRDARARDRSLMPLDWSHLAVGQVGEVGICTYGNHAGEAIRCQRKLDAGSFLGCHSVHDGFGTLREFDSPSVVFVGIDKDDGSELEVGKCSSIRFTAVVTGTTQIEIPRMGLKTVFVVEKFDPDKPFH